MDYKKTEYDKAFYFKNENTTLESFIIQRLVIHVLYSLNYLP